MEVIGKLKEIGEPRYFQGRDGNVKVVDVVIASGDDEIVVGAIDRQADQFTADGTPLLQGALVKAHIQVSVTKGENASFNTVRLRSIGVILETKAF